MGIELGGHIGTAALKNDAENMNARSFWDTHDGHCPELAAIMLHLTSKVTGSGEAERNWKDTRYVHTTRGSQSAHAS